MYLKNIFYFVMFKAQVLSVISFMSKQMHVQIYLFLIFKIILIFFFLNFLLFRVAPRRRMEVPRLGV